MTTLDQLYHFKYAKIKEARSRGPLLGATRKRNNIATSTEVSIRPNLQIQCNTPIKPLNRSHTWYLNPGGINLSCITISYCGQHCGTQKFTFDSSNSTFQLNQQGRATLFFLLSWVACSINCPLHDFGIHKRIRFASHILSSG